MTDGRAMTGRLAGIARHAVPKGPMEVIDTAIVTLDGGFEGDVRGRVKPGGRGRRQVTLIERADWEAALAEIDRDIPCWLRISTFPKFRAPGCVSGLSFCKSPWNAIRATAWTRSPTDCARP